MNARDGSKEAWDIDEAILNSIPYGHYDPRWPGPLFEDKSKWQKTKVAPIKVEKPKKQRKSHGKNGEL